MKAAVLALLFLAACSPKSSSEPEINRVEKAANSVGLGNATTYWKCVGQLDEKSDRFLAIAFENDAVHGKTLLIHRVHFSAGNSGYLNEGLYLMRVSADLEQTVYKISAETSDRTLLTYDTETQTVDLHFKIPGETVRQISCRDHRVTSSF